MCMSGGGGSGRSLRAGQLGVGRRGVSTSRVTGYNLDKGWSAPKITKTLSKLAPTSGWASVTSDYGKAQTAIAKTAAKANIWGQPTIRSKAETKALQKANAEKVAAKKAGTWVEPAKAAPAEVRVAASPTTNPFTGQAANVEYRTAKGKETSIAASRKDGTQRITTNASYVKRGNDYYKEIETSTSTYNIDWVAKTEKNALQAAQVDDGAKARIKSRAARSAVANVKQASAFSSKRPRGGSLRIDSAGAQVSGGNKIV